MDLMLMRIFQRQVQLQCEALLVATHDFNSAMTTDDVEHAWISIQNILTSAANISKALWGSKRRQEDARRPLRESLQVDDSSVFLHVAMRDHFEHYDERLDYWWERSTNHNYLDMSIMPPTAVQGLAESDMFRVYDPTTGDLVFWGERFNIAALAQEAARILPIVKAEANRPHWEPPPPTTEAPHL